MPSMAETEHVNKTVEEYLDEVDYSFKDYIPSLNALNFINFIKLVNDGSEENKSPVVHMKVLDDVFTDEKRTCVMCHRGFAKTTLIGEYLFLYIAVFGKIENFTDVSLALYVSDSIENGVKNMRKNLEFRWQNSDFLQRELPQAKFTDVRWEFINKGGHKLVVKGYGAKTGVRGVKEMGVRPNLAVLDDIVSDEDARSATVIATIENTVHKAVSKALHPKASKIIWAGTPFNMNDPLYKAIESGAWSVSCYPIAESFDTKTTEAEFMGSWEDRFPYEYVKDEFEAARKQGIVSAFDGELMLRIMSDDQRVIQIENIIWYQRSGVIQHSDNYNFYITTDLATSESKTADHGVISVWAVNNNGDYLWIDGTMKRQSLNAHLDDLFKFVSTYGPIEVGVEVDGQQGGFIDYIKERMINTNTFFKLASQAGSRKEGIRSAAASKSKFSRFMVMQPLFEQNKIWFPEEMRGSIIMKEAMEELSNVSTVGFNSRHDDFLDTVAQLQYLNIYKPGAKVQYSRDPDSDIWNEIDTEVENEVNSYVF